jgi:hypothetical protein
MKAINLLAGLVLALGAGSAPAQEGIAPNGSYSSIGLSLNRVNYASNKCLLGECHTGYGAFGINLSYQVIPNMIIGLRTMGGQDSLANTTIKESQGGVYFGFVMGVGETLDIGGLISPLSKHLETCLGSLCGTADDTGNNVEFFGKWWLNDDRTFHLGLTLDNYAYANGSTNPNSATRYHSTGLSAGYLLGGHHELSLSGSRLKDADGNDVSSTGGIGYNYLF